MLSGGLQPGEVAMPDDKNKDNVAGQAQQVTQRTNSMILQLLFIGTH